MQNGAMVQVGRLQKCTRKLAVMKSHCAAYYWMSDANFWMLNVWRKLLDAECLTQTSGCWMSDPNFWMLNVWRRLLDAECLVQTYGCWMSDANLWMLNVWRKLLDAECLTQTSGCWMSDANFWMLNVWCKLLDAECLIHNLSVWYNAWMWYTMPTSVVHIRRHSKMAPKITIVNNGVTVT